MSLPLTPPPPAHTALSSPSEWVQRWSHLIAAGSRVLDLACGHGRHVHWFASRGCIVTAVDRDAQTIEPLRPIAEVLVADVENGPWPLTGRHFDAIVVTNYLWRPLQPLLLASLAEGGVLIHETFADGQQEIGRPSNPQFLLQPGELLQAASGLQVVAYENGVAADPPRFVQRIVAVRTGAGQTPRARHVLPAPERFAGWVKSRDSEETA